MSYCYKCVATYNLSKLEPFKIFFFHLLLCEGDTCCRQKRRPRNLGEILLTLLDRVGVGRRAGLCSDVSVFILKKTSFSLPLSLCFPPLLDDVTASSVVRRVYFEGLHHGG